MITMFVPADIVQSVRFFTALLDERCKGMFVSPVSLIGESPVVIGYISSGEAGSLFELAVRHPELLDIEAVKARLPHDVLNGEHKANIDAMTIDRLRNALASCEIHDGYQETEVDGQIVREEESPLTWIARRGWEKTVIPMGGQ